MSCERLLKCPFCGGEAKINSWAFLNCSALVKCKKCGARTLEYKSASYEDAKLNAIKAWNNRKNIEDMLKMQMFDSLKYTRRE